MGVSSTVQLYNSVKKKKTQEGSNAHQEYVKARSISKSPGRSRREVVALTTARVPVVVQRLFKFGFVYKEKSERI